MLYLAQIQKLNICILSTLITVALFITGLQPLKGQEPDTTDLKVEQYLRRLELQDLNIDFLAARVARETDAQKRILLARRLATLFSQKLMLSNEDRNRTDLESKALNLIQLYPELNTPSLSIAMAHASYQKSLSRFNDWWFDGQVPTVRREIQSEFDVLIETLSQLNQQFATKYEELQAQLQLDSNISQVIARSLAQTENVLLHSHYLLGWANYFVSIIEPSSSSQSLANARQNFTGFLQLEPDTQILELDDDWIDFSSPWSVRATLGLAMTLQAQQQAAASQHLMGLIQKNVAPQQLDEFLDFWNLNRWIYSNQFDQALQEVQSFRLRNRTESLKTKFWTLAINHARAIRGKAPKIAERIHLLGLAGLARQMNSHQLESVMAESPFEIRDDRFIDLWVSGFMALSASHADDQEQKLREANAFLDAAISKVDSEVPETDSACCRYLLGTIRFRQNNFSDAANDFGQVIDGLDVFNRSLAARALWLQIQSLIEVTKSNPRRSGEAFRALEQMMHRFPDSTFAREIEFQKIRLAALSVSPEVAIRRFEKIEASNVKYPDALFEKIRIQYSLWLAAHQNKEDAQRGLRDQLIEWAVEFEGLENASLENKIRASLLIMDSTLRLAKASTDTELDDWKSQFERQFQQAAKKIERLPPNSDQLVSEFRYYSFLFKRQFQPKAAAVEEAEWLASKAIGTRYEKAALIFLAECMNVDNVEPPTLQKAIALYSRLSTLLGRSREELATSHNARVAYSKLGELYIQSKKFAEAVEIFSLLHDVDSKVSSYLESLANSQTELNQLDDAIKNWRQLAAGVSAGTDKWYNAKLNLIRCIAKSDIDSATKLLTQTIKLDPNMAPDRKLQFDDLAKELQLVDQGNQ